MRASEHSCSCPRDKHKCTGPRTHNRTWTMTGAAANHSTMMPMIVWTRKDQQTKFPSPSLATPCPSSFDVPKIWTLCDLWPLKMKLAVTMLGLAHGEYVLYNLLQRFTKPDVTDRVCTSHKSKKMAGKIN
eukprot:1651979-Rhodomonas_salina.1